MSLVPEPQRKKVSRWRSEVGGGCRETPKTDMEAKASNGYGLSSEICDSWKALEVILVTEVSKTRSTSVAWWSKSYQLSLSALRHGQYQVNTDPSPMVTGKEEHVLSQRMKQLQVGWRPSLLGWRPLLVIFAQSPCTRKAHPEVVSCNRSSCWSPLSIRVNFLKRRPFQTFFSGP